MSLRPDISPWRARKTVLLPRPKSPTIMDNPCFALIAYRTLKRTPRIAGPSHRTDRPAPGCPASAHS
jgi:hypothetical protein